MRLLPLFRRSPSGRATEREAADAPLSADETVAALRSRARRRLIGATVLVAAAVFSLPWLFESQPRPLPPDLPIELARKDGAVPPADGRTDRTPVPAPATGDTPSSASTQPASAADSLPARTDADAPPMPSALPAPAPKASHPSVSPPPPPTAAPLPDAARARALLDGKALSAAPSTPLGTRYIVQLGAYAEADAVTAARGKAEHLGLKTYTQVVDAPAGRRTRVRVGPYASKAEADHAVAQLKSASLPAVVLTLGGE